MKKWEKGNEGRRMEGRKKDNGELEKIEREM